MIPKGTMVRVRTSNGGEIVAPLWFNYRPTYDAYIERNGQCVMIPITRLTSVDKISDMTT